jgi:HEAT repeat protein
MTACTVCARRDATGTVPLLARRCAVDPDLGVRLHAIKVLGDSRDPAAIAALAAVLDDPDPAIRGPTIDALKRASGRDLGDDATAWRRWATNPAQSTARWWLSEALRKLF